jgi:hypothetical protein
METTRGNKLLSSGNADELNDCAIVLRYQRGSVEL